MYLSVIIPAKNEQKHIKKTIESVFDFLSKKDFEFEIIVVANNSTDQTGAMVRELMETMPSLRMIEYSGVVGKGYAVRRGMLESHGEYRLFMDADNSTTIDHVDLMMPYFEKGYDVVIGSIALEGAQAEQGSEPAWRKLFGKMGNLYIQILAVPGIWDTQRGFKILSERAAKDIFSRSKITQFGFDIEMLALARKFGYKIKEVPIKWQNDPNTASHPTLSSYFQVLLDTLKIRIRLMTGGYNKAV